MIECKKVSFSYPPNETDIGDREGHGTLRNIDLSINDGGFCTALRNIGLR